MSPGAPFLLRARSSFRYWTSLWSFYTSASSLALISFRFTRCMTHLARSANFKVEIVSSMCSANGETVATRYVWVFPPTESWRRRVSLDSRKGTCGCALEEESYWITFPRVVRDRLMFLSSSKCFACISSSLLTFSEPAKSPRFSFERFSMPLESTWSVSTSSWNKLCDRDERMFNLVARFTLFLSPLASKRRQSASL